MENKRTSETKKTKTTETPMTYSPGLEVAAILKNLLLRCREAQLEAAAHRSAAVEI